jgi:sugar O-acyltransferase (sialic acid O-acetyltransferase NeuD family)
VHGKRNLYILSAGEFGRELEHWLEHVPETARDWKVAGFLHSGASHLAEYPSDLSVVGNWEDFNFTDTDMVVLGLVGAEWKQRFYDALKERVEFLTFIHPSVILGKFVEVGVGSVICPNCVITTNVKLGKCVTLNCGTQIGHDVAIDEYASLMPHVDLGGHVQVGKRVFMGTKATVIPSRKIADDVTVGAGSVVVRHIKRPCTVFGNPAVKIAE